MYKHTRALHKHTQAGLASRGAAVDSVRESFTELYFIRFLLALQLLQIHSDAVGRQIPHCPTVRDPLRSSGTDSIRPVYEPHI